LRGQSGVVLGGGGEGCEEQKRGDETWVMHGKNLALAGWGGGRGICQQRNMRNSCKLKIRKIPREMS
jgi:hypothetical protein